MLPRISIRVYRCEAETFTPQSVIIVISLQDSYLPRLKTGNNFLSKCADKNTPMYIYVGLAYRGLLNHKYFEKADYVTWLFVKSFCTLFPIKRCQPYQGQERKGLKLNTCIWSSWGKLVHFSGAPPFSNLRGSPCIGFSLTAHQEILCCKAVFTQGGDYFFLSSEVSLDIQIT